MILKLLLFLNLLLTVNRVMVKFVNFALNVSASIYTAIYFMSVRPVHDKNKCVHKSLPIICEDKRKKIPLTR